MKKAISKIVAFLLLAMMFSMSAACATNKGNVLYVVNFKPEFQEYYEYINEKFEEKEGIKVEYVSVDTTNYSNVLSSRFQSGLLDVFFSQIDYMINGQSDYMLELTDMGVEDLFEPDVLESCKIDGKVYTLPLTRNMNTVFYNKKIFEEYEIEVPKTYAEFISVCETLQNLVSNPVGGKTKIAAPILLSGKTEWAVNMMTNQIYLEYVLSQQPNFYDDLKKNEDYAKVNNAVWTEAFTRIKNISPYLNSTFAGLDYSTSSIYFSNGNKGAYYAMMPDGSWNYSQIMKANPSFEVGCFSLPGADSEEDCNITPTKLGYTVSIFKNTQKAEYCKKYIQFLFEEENYEKFLNDTMSASVIPSVPSDNAFVNAMYNQSGETYFSTDSLRGRYLPLEPQASDVIQMLQGKMEVSTVLNNWNTKIAEAYKDWSQYV